MKPLIVHFRREGGWFVHGPSRIFTYDVQRRRLFPGVECIGTNAPSSVLYCTDSLSYERVFIEFVRATSGPKPFIVRAWKYGVGTLTREQSRVGQEKFNWMLHDALDIVYRGRNRWPRR